MECRPCLIWWKWMLLVRVNVLGPGKVIKIQWTGADNKIGELLVGSRIRHKKGNIYQSRKIFNNILKGLPMVVAYSMFPLENLIKSKLHVYSNKWSKTDEYYDDWMINGHIDSRITQCGFFRYIKWCSSRTRSERLQCKNLGLSKLYVWRWLKCSEWMEESRNSRNVIMLEWGDKHEIFSTTMEWLLLQSVLDECFQYVN